MQAFLQGHLWWAARHDVPMPSRYARDLLADKGVAWVSRHYAYWVILGVALPALAGLLIFGGWPGMLFGLYWGGVVHIAIGHQLIWSVNSVAHTFGYRSYETPDRSTNNALLAIPTFGETWHNNHHHAATSSKFSHCWWELDIGWWMICALRFAGLVSDARVFVRGHRD